MRLDAGKAATAVMTFAHSRRGAHLCRVVAFAVNEAGREEVELR